MIIYENRISVDPFCDSTFVAFQGFFEWHLFLLQQNLIDHVIDPQNPNSTSLQDLSK